MAEIKMDISEYELLKENKKLLEDSLKKERELQKQIEKLTDDKLKALEDAKMKVIKVNKTEITEHMYVESDVTKYHCNNTKIYQLLNLLNFNSYNVRIPDDLQYQQVIAHLFKRVTTTSTPSCETITCGLDDIKVELRNDIQACIDKKTKQTIADGEKAIIRNNELLIENNKLTSENKFLVSSNTSLTKKCEELETRLMIYQKDSSKYNLIKHTLSNGCNFWTRGKLLAKINEIIK